MLLEKQVLLTEHLLETHTTSKWEKDGITRYTTKIIGSELQLVGIKNQESAKLNEAPLPGHKEASDWNNDNSKDDWGFDDVPF